ncbi:MAG: hypothetical protein LBU99_06710 [Spirochaetaceae bacterium]|jgi:polyhydroxyalkanoate synthesis regulator phasin|nr:hypothetical protein [Spirochaetaceae bacterium]
MTNESKILSILETMAKDVSGLNQRMGQVEQDIGELKKDVSELKHDVDKLKHDVDGLNGLKTEFDILKEDVGRIKEIVIRIENEQALEIKALFDGYNMSRDLHLTNQGRITALEEKYESHDVRILALSAERGGN